MLDTEIKKYQTHFLATFTLQLNQPVHDVWSWLTENDKLTQWFSELHIESLEKGGNIRFDFGNGTHTDMLITDYVPNSVIQYTWGNDEVRFEVHPDEAGSTLIFKETIRKITDHTAKDLAGWHVCLLIIEALMNERSIIRQDEWKKWYDYYQKKIEKVK